MQRRLTASGVASKESFDKEEAIAHIVASGNSSRSVELMTGCRPKLPAEASKCKLTTEHSFHRHYALLIVTATVLGMNTSMGTELQPMHTNASMTDVACDAAARHAQFVVTTTKAVMLCVY